jgi:polyisoprenoid-binding protein YceI
MAEAATASFERAVLIRETSAAGTWRLDPGPSSVAFAVKHLWGLIAVRGRFAALAGAARVTADGRITASLDIDAGSVDTGQRRRDKHLRSADFLDVDHHPTLEVRAHEVLLESRHAASVVADVVVTGVARTMTFPVDVALSEGGKVATIDIVVVVDRAGFGMTWNPLRAAADTAEVTAHLVFVHADD